MVKKRKLCFVIMGFGRKTDLSTGKTLDLDKTYKNIIKPAVEKTGFRCVRADEIQDSGLIDKSMYALLMRADLVVADISTYNPNAIYELGIRHAVRPFSTIILKEQQGVIPFDLSHTRIFTYLHSGDDIGFDEANRCQKLLREMIEEVSAKNEIDSPLYSYIKDVEPPKITPREYQAIIDELSEREDKIFAISESAQLCMEDSRFSEAMKLWQKAEMLVPNEPYFVQQRALATYKSKEPTELSSLIDALNIIQDLDPDGESNDPETLGISGAICKGIWRLNGDAEFLERATKYYRKGFEIRKDYYNGENYALCLDSAVNTNTTEDERSYFRISARKVRERIIETLSSFCDESLELKAEDRWRYATLANCFFGLKKDDLGKEFEEKFLKVTEASWESETYFDNKEALLKLLE